MQDMMIKLDNEASNKSGDNNQADNPQYSSNATHNNMAENSNLPSH